MFRFYPHDSAKNRKKKRSVRTTTPPADCSAFEPIVLLSRSATAQRHGLTADGQQTAVMITELSPLQRTILRLLGHSTDQYGR